MILSFFFQIVASSDISFKLKTSSGCGLMMNVGWCTCSCLGMLFNLLFILCEDFCFCCKFHKESPFPCTCLRWPATPGTPMPDFEIVLSLETALASKSSRWCLSMKIVLGFYFTVASCTWPPPPCIACVWVARSQVGGWRHFQITSGMWTWQKQVLVRPWLNVDKNQASSLFVLK